jgi:hypothetical protein
MHRGCQLTGIAGHGKDQTVSVSAVNEVSMCEGWQAHSCEMAVVGS